MKDKWLTVPDLMKALNISRSHAYSLVAEGHFVAMRVGSKATRVLESSVQAYITRQVSLFMLENGLTEK